MGNIQKKKPTTKNLLWVGTDFYAFYIFTKHRKNSQEPFKALGEDNAIPENDRLWLQPNKDTKGFREQKANEFFGQ